MRRIMFSVIALLIAGMALAARAQMQPRGGFAAVPVPGQPAAPGVPVPAPAIVQPPAAPRPPTPGAPAQKPEEQMRVVADPATNSLVIYGTAQEFQNIKNILKDLDLIPRQVLLDVLVAEVTLKEGESLGVDYEILKKDRVTIFGQTFGSRGALRTLGSLFPSGGQFGNGLSGIVGGNTVSALINALATDNRAKILSSPSVLASDNRPARIQVGSEEPIATGQLVAVTGAASPSSSTSIQYRNTGRIVTIIPQVNSQGLVNLQILAEVSQRGAPVSVGGSDFPSFDTRQAETTAVVQDGDTLAIGGIIADNRTHDRTGIPYLMDVPVIGRFFGSTNDQIVRTELIMLITPHVIRNRDQGQQITEDFKKSLSTVRNELDRMAREREKLQQRPLLEQKPALPGPSGDVAPPPSPAPAPSAAPAAPQAPVPLRPISMPLNIPAPLQPAEQVGFPTPVRSSSGNGVPASTPPAYALSVSRPIEPARATPRPMAKLQPQPMAQAKRQWAVQVAALDTAKDAESIADLLRKNGYDAYVMTFENQGKTWHRVRVGRFVELSPAMQLKNRLADSAQFKHAYVAAN